jgi:hypothetical protein
LRFVVRLKPALESSVRTSMRDSSMLERNCV